MKVGVFFFCFNPPPIWRHSYVERERRDEPGRNQLTSRDLLFFSGPCSKVVGFYTSMWEIKSLRQSRRIGFLNLASLKIKCFASEFVTEIIRTQKLCITCIIAAYIFSHKAKTQYFHMEKQTQIWKPFLWRISFWETTLAIRYALSHRCMLKESLPIYLNAIWMNHQLSITSDLQKVLKNCYFIPLHYLNDAFYRDEAFYRFTCLNSLAGCLAKASHMCT